MLKELLEGKLGQVISESDFAAIMKMTTDDIKFNNINFNRKTSPSEILVIAEISYAVLKR